MTFVAAICGLQVLGPPRLGLLSIEAPSLSHAIVEAHRVACRDHPPSKSTGYKVLVRPADHPADSTSSVAYEPVRRARCVEFNPDRSQDD